MQGMIVKSSSLTKISDLLEEENLCNSDRRDSKLNIEYMSNISVLSKVNDTKDNNTNVLLGLHREKKIRNLKYSSSSMNRLMELKERSNLDTCSNYSTKSEDDAEETLEGSIIRNKGKLQRRSSLLNCNERFSDEGENDSYDFKTEEKFEKPFERSLTRTSKLPRRSSLLNNNERFCDEGTSENCKEEETSRNRMLKLKSNSYSERSSDKSITGYIKFPRRLSLLHGNERFHGVRRNSNSKEENMNDDESHNSKGSGKKVHTILFKNNQFPNSRRRSTLSHVNKFEEDNSENSAANTKNRRSSISNFRGVHVWKTQRSSLSTLGRDESSRSLGSRARTTITNAGDEFYMTTNQLSARTLGHVDYDFGKTASNLPKSRPTTITNAGGEFFVMRSRRSSSDLQSLDKPDPDKDVTTIPKKKPVSISNAKDEFFAMQNRHPNLGLELEDDISSQKSADGDVVGGLLGLMHSTMDLCPDENEDCSVTEHTHSLNSNISEDRLPHHQQQQDRNPFDADVEWAKDRSERRLDKIDSQYQLSSMLEHVFDREYHKALNKEQMNLNAKTISLRQSSVATLFMFILYIIFGCIFYSYVAGWNTRDCLFFIVYTVTTVGYGNHYVPDSRIAQAFTTCYLLTGMFLLSVVASECFQYIQLEALKVQFSRDNSELARKSIDQYSNVNVSSSVRRTSMEMFTETIEKESNKSVLARAVDWIMVLFLSLKKFISNNIIARYMSVFVPHTILVVFLALVVGSIEGWNVVKSIYFAVVTVSTVGYGDVVPKKSAGIWFTTLYMPLALIWVPLFFANTARLYMRIHTWNMTRIKQKYFRYMEDDVEKANTDKRFLRKTNISMTEALSSLDFSTPEYYESHEAPSLNCRLLVMERMVSIIADDVARGRCDVIVKAKSITVDVPGLKNVMKKWMIPRKAKAAFKEVALKVILYSGSRSLATEGTSYLLSLTLNELHELFGPVLVAMGTTETMKTWLAATEITAQQRMNI